MFDLATDVAMKQALEGDVHRVSVQLWVLKRLRSALWSRQFFSLHHFQGLTRHVRKYEGLLLKVSLAAGGDSHC